MATRNLAIVSMMLVLAACQAKSVSEEAAAPARMVGDSDALTADKTGDAGKPAADPLAVPQLAYDYRYSFVAPAAGVEALLKADQAACERAGPAACQMIALQSNADRDAGHVDKTLELRVSPQWLKAWQGGLDASVAKAGGRISYQNVSSEDLSLQIVDTEATLKNKEALRDRLAEIIRHSPGKISELIEAENQLAEVQTEIDSARSALAVMQKRVATTHVTLTYQSEAVAASNGTFSPLADAGRNVLRNIVAVFAGLITLASFLLPLALVGVPAVWYGRKWLKGRAKSKVETPKEN